MFFLLFLVFHRQFCGHGSFARQIRPYKKLIEIPRKRVINGKATRENIRVHMDFTYLEMNNREDTRRCYEVGQWITWYGTPQECVEGDIMTEKKYEIITQSIENVARFMSRAFRVDPAESIPVVPIEEYPVPVSEMKNTDLYIGVYARPFGSKSTLASASSVAHDANTHRPIQGVININLQSVPNEPSDISTPGRRDFFEVCFHEICHVLGIAEDDYQYWRDENGQPYTNVPINITFPGRARNSLIFNSPAAHEAVKAKYGVEEFIDVNGHRHRSGIEMEDEGGHGTAVCHLESRTYFTELMSAYFYDYAYISNLTLALLKDTGWYDVDFSVAEPYPYGDYRSILGETEPFRDFLSKSPSESFPKHYFPEGKYFTYVGYPPSCSYDHRFPGYYDLVKCMGRYEQYCNQYFTLTDKNGERYFSLSNLLADGIPLSLLTTDSICPRQVTVDGRKEDTYCSVAIDSGLETSLCFPMWCTGNELFVHAGGSVVKCEQKFQEIVANDTMTIICPDPKVVCGYIQFSNPSPPTPTQEPTQEPTKEPTQEPTKEPTQKPTDASAGDISVDYSETDTETNTDSDADSDFWDKIGISPAVFSIVIVICVIVVVAIVVAIVIYKKKRDNKAEPDDIHVYMKT
ncbi:hypothetical protein TRFO_27033 [Tritrichomonas foetus]|uniref:GP63-like n=1 Tax=Tritrichomonas foetus TaxID=1144522 RepID=A0A1J4K6E0_9EUKA|nr:hypothetical protein TRFO_27033 [Tritrichomonas foetus]|eukprot:OHT05276.1 hypothetical protein TRFO_27033 [Tritrichomonas foetus]